MALTELLPRSNRAPALYADYWLNGEPVIVSALQGSVIFLFFWDYSCAQSLRFLPYVKEWSRKYHPFGLVTVGVHSPRFPFAKDPDGVQKALDRLDVRFPVAMDNEGFIAAGYGVRSLPLGVIIDKYGYVRALIHGDGSFIAAERTLQGYVYDIGMLGELPLLMDPVRDIDREGSIVFHPTPELMAGYRYGSLGNVEGYFPESYVEYADPGIYIEGKLYAEGTWLNGRDRIRLAMPVQKEGQIIVSYQGADVSGVFASEEGTEVRLAVHQDDEPLTLANGGNDIVIGGDGSSVLRVSEPRLYSIARNKEFGEHLLRLSASGGDLAVYAISFGTSLIPDLISTN